MSKETTEEKVIRKEYYFVPLSKIEVEDGFNAREDYGDIDALAVSIKNNGIKVPLRGYKKRGEDTYVVTDGHRRLKAVNLAIKKGAVIDAVPFITEAWQSDDRRVLDMIVCNDGKPLTMLEEAEVYRRLIAWGWTEARVAKETGKTKTAVNNCLILLKATPELKNKIQTGVVSATVVLEKLRKKDAKEVDKEVQDAVVKSGGKKITGKHLKQDKVEEDISKSLNYKALDRVVELLENGYTNLNESKLGILTGLSEFAKGNIELEDLADLLV